MSGKMVRAAVSVQEHVRDPVLVQELVEEHRPFGEMPAEIACTVRPIEPVAAAQIDAVYLDALTRHLLAEATEEGSRRALEEEEGARLHGLPRTQRCEALLPATLKTP